VTTRLDSNASRNILARGRVMLLDRLLAMI
jgi:hypothetical protein